MLYPHIAASTAGDTLVLVRLVTGHQLVTKWRPRERTSLTYGMVKLISTLSPKRSVVFQLRIFWKYFNYLDSEYARKVIAALWLAAMVYSELKYAPDVLSVPRNIVSILWVQIFPFTGSDTCVTIDAWYIRTHPIRQAIAPDSLCCDLLYSSSNFTCTMPLVFSCMNENCDKIL